MLTIEILENERQKLMDYLNRQSLEFRPMHKLVDDSFKKMMGLKRVENEFSEEEKQDILEHKWVLYTQHGEGGEARKYSDKFLEFLLKEDGQFWFSVYDNDKDDLIIERLKFYSLDDLWEYRNRASNN